MQIKSIELENFKGQNRVQHFTGLDFITGSNGSGKSTCIEAYCFALQKKIYQDQDKPISVNKELLRYSNTLSMEVKVNTDSNFKFSRKIVGKEKRNTDGLKYISGSEKVNPSNEEIEGKMGVQPVILDFGQFLRMTDTQKRDFFYSLTKTGSQYTRESVDKLLREELLSEALLENNADQYDTQESYIEECMKQWTKNKSIFDAIDDMYNWAKEKTSEWDKKKKEATAAAKKLAERKNQLKETDAQLNELKQSLKELRTKLSEITSKIQTNQHRKQESQNVKNQIEAIKGEIEGIKHETAPDIEKIKSELIEYQNRETTLNQQIVELEQTKEVINEKILNLKNQNIKDDSLIESYKSKTTALITEENQLDQYIEQARSSENHTCLTLPVGCPVNLQNFIPEWEKRKDDIKKEVELYSGHVKVLLSQIQKREADIKHLGTENAQNNDTYQSVKDELGTLKETITAAKIELVKAESFEDNRKKRLENTDKRLKEALNITPHVLINEEILINQKTSLENQIQSTEGLVEEKTTAKIRLEDVQETLIDAEEADINAICYSQLKEKLGPKGLQGKIMEENILPSNAAVDKNIKDFGLKYSFFVDTKDEKGKPIFNFGYIDSNDIKRGFKMISRGELMILILAMAKTIIQQSDLPCRVLWLDNAESIDSVNKKKVLSGLKEWYRRGELDNVVVSAVDNFMYKLTDDDLEGYAITNLDEEKQKNAS